jgi:stage II sporulation protein GA (sporulation sigma-E factor processing peptidase)
MNTIILLSTAKLIKRRYSWIQLIISAAIGAIYAVLSYFPQFKYLFDFFMKIFFSFLMVIIAFTPSSIKDFIRLTGVFYTISFVFGGASFGLFYFFNGLKQTVNGISYIRDFPIKSLIASIFIGYFVIRYCWDFIQYKIKRERIITEVNICLDGKNINVNALVDTGNALTEPITRTPVLVVEYRIIKEILPEEIQTLFEDNVQDFNKIANIMSDSDWVTRFRMIPFNSLGRENGMMIGFKPDEVMIQENNQKTIIKNVIIGVHNRKLSTDDEYSALVHPDLLNNQSQ